MARDAMNRVFLLSPASAGGVRAKMLLREEASFALANQVRSMGAPLADDWASLSLSDLAVPWVTVERRLTALAASGLALALYNPRSAGRAEQFSRALAVLLAHRDPDTPVALATDVARDRKSVV